MTEHRPECWAKHESDPPAWCICDELRACEERVEESMDRAWSQTVQLAVAHTRTATLDAAREAVALLPWKVAVSFGPIDCDESCEHGPCVCSGVMRPEAWMTGPAEAIAAIDKLKEKP